jgi:hypothetical protein
MDEFFSNEKFIFKILWESIMKNYVIKYERQIFFMSNILSKIYYKLMYKSKKPLVFTSTYIKAGSYPSPSRKDTHDNRISDRIPTIITANKISRTIINAPKTYQRPIHTYARTTTK